MKNNNKKSVLVITLSTAVLMLFFQNCRSQVQIDDVSKAGVFSAPDDENSAANTPEPSHPSPTPVPSAPTLPLPSPLPEPVSPPLGQAPSPEPSNPAPAPAPSPAPQPAPMPAPQPGVTPVPENPYNPNDPNIGLLPTDGEWASVAYEDNIGSTYAGDRDYNDAVFNYRVSEQYNAQSQLVRIFIEVRLREKISTSTHRLFLSLNGNPSSYFDNIDYVSLPAFAGQAKVTVKYHTGETEVTESAKNKLINLFKSTNNTINKVNKIQIDIAQPELNVNSAAVKVVNYKKYRLILQNHGNNNSRTGIDIAEINPSNEMLSNGNGYPFGFMIPTNWDPPNEGQAIDYKYINFHKYREWLNSSQQGPIPDSAKNWYK